MGSIMWRENIMEKIIIRVNEEVVAQSYNNIFLEERTRLRERMNEGNNLGCSLSANLLESSTIYWDSVPTNLQSTNLEFGSLTEFSNALL